MKYDIINWVIKMIDITLLEYLIVISNSQSLLEASNKLKITQPTLTRSIQKLEDELGILLFDRYTNKIVLNDNGRKVIEESKDLIKAYYTFKEKIDTYKNTIRIGYLSKGIIYKYQNILFEQFKGYDLTFKNASNEELKYGILNNQFDIIFSLDNINDEKINFLPLGKENLILSIPNNHFLSNEKFLSLSEINGSTINPHDLDIFNKAIKKYLPLSKVSNEYDEANISLDTSLQYHLHKDDNRSFVKLNDKETTLYFYVSFKKEYKDKMNKLK